MAFNTNEYGYLVDPMFSFIDSTGKPLVGGYLVVCQAGTTTKVLTHNNWDSEESYNPERIPLDITGRTFGYVIAKKGEAYKILVCDADHDENDPVKTIDKKVSDGASVTTSGDIVQGLNSAETSSKFFEASVVDNKLKFQDKNYTTATDISAVDIVAKDKTTGEVVKVDGKISNLTQTATEADLKAGNYLALDGAEGTKRLPAEAVAKAAELETERTRATSVENSIIERNNFQKFKISENENVYSSYTNDGYWDASGNYKTELQYNNYTLISSIYDYELFFDANTFVGYIQLEIFSGEPSAETFIKRLRTTENNLPTEQNKLKVRSGQRVVISYAFQTTERPVTTNLMSCVELSDPLKNSAVQAAIPTIDLKDKAVFESLTTKENGLVLNESSKFISIHDGYYCNAKGVLTSDNSYITYVFNNNKDTPIWVKRKSTYLSICVCDTILLGDSTRYRYLAGGEDTLPYESNKMDVSKGKFIALSVRKAYNTFEIILDNEEYVKSFKGGIPLAEEHIRQVANAIAEKSLVVKYIGASGGGFSTERAEIYIPTKIGYCLYHFVHSVNVERNADCWRIDKAYACDDSLAVRFDLTVTGEWECALHLKDRDDFSGGVVHGDEICNDVKFFIDGKIIDLRNETSLENVGEFRIISTSDLYDPADNSTIIAKHGCEHIFTKDGVKINQSVKWLGSYTITSCYLAMNLPAKSVTDHCYLDTEFTYDNVSSKFGTYNKVNKIVVLGESSGVQNIFEIIGEYPRVSSGEQFILTDNGGGAYNKCYFVVNSTSENQVSSGTLWKSSHRVSFTVAK